VALGFLKIFNDKFVVSVGYLFDRIHFPYLRGGGPENADNNKHHNPSEGKSECYAGAWLVPPNQKRRNASTKPKKKESHNTSANRNGSVTKSNFCLLLAISRDRVMLFLFFQCTPFLCVHEIWSKENQYLKFGTP